MPICIKLPAAVRFKVAGTITSETGEPEQFVFTVDAPRMATSDDVRALDADIQAAEKAGSRTPIADVLSRRFTGWAGPVDDELQPVPFSAENCRALLCIPGLALMTYERYIAGCSVQPR